MSLVVVSKTVRQSEPSGLISCKSTPSHLQELELPSTSGVLAHLQVEEEEEEEEEQEQEVVHLRTMTRLALHQSLLSSVHVTGLLSALMRNLCLDPHRFHGWAVSDLQVPEHPTREFGLVLCCVGMHRKLGWK